mmetsp:Transcript_3489/g.4967  ORF Transcript_3489/g.4967 Transcript_3489/m.4967 type:complete len:304 (-) Transcript_3489:1417-2328(-)
MTIMKALHHPSLIAAIWLLAIAASGVHGALNFKIFNDPKSVFTKEGKSSCTSAAVACVPVDIDALAAGEMLKAQDKEDYCLLKHYFPGVCEGRYLEIGAGDGITFSNSWVFYNSDLGWSGVNVELNPDSYEQLVRNRHDDIANIQAAVCSVTQPVHYAHDVTSTHVGGIWEFTTEKYREKFWPGITLFNTIEIMCTPIQSILDQTLGKNAKHYFDFATIDIEGAELNSLLGIDWSRTKFGILIVEKNKSDEINQQMHDLLRVKGYTLMENDEDECGIRNWYYKNDNFEQIYSRIRAPMSQGWM